MDPLFWRRLSELFAAARELEGEDRIKFLAERCGDDKDLFGQVLSLLDADRAPGFLDSTLKAPTFRSTQVIAGRFKIIRCIGKGGMGTVFEAEDLLLNDRVALKTIRPEIAPDPLVRERFKREILLGKRLSHSNVCRVHDLVVDRSDTGTEVLFLAMQFLDGETLAARIGRGAIPENEALPLLEDMADGLSAAHQADVIHRDFKSGNVMLVQRNSRTCAVITDFGLAHAVRDGPSLTRSGILGSIDYMAPEQIRGEKLGPTADVYALGAVLYEMVTGVRPFTGDSQIIVAIKHLNDKPQPPRDIVPHLNPNWNQAILKCLEKLPSERFQSATEVKMAVLQEQGLAPPMRRRRTQKSRAFLRLIGSMTWRVVGAVLLLGAAVSGIYSLLHRSAPVPFQKFTITQVTNSGKSVRAAISPDGRYVLTVMDDNGRQSLWLRNAPTGSDTQVLAPSASRYESLAFSPDGNYIYFRKAQNAIENYYNLYRSPILGGSPQAIVRDIDSGITFSPDAEHIAYIRSNDPVVGKYRILTASVGGNNEKILQTESTSGQGPRNLAWSPSGTEIYYSQYVYEQGLCVVDVLDIATGKSHRFATFKGKFPSAIQWLPDRSGLFAIYGQPGVNFRRNQIGFLPSKGGDIEPITRDTNKYATLTLSADGKTLATVLGRTYATVSIFSKAGHLFVNPRLLLSQGNEFDDWSALSWGSDGNLFVSNTGRLSRLGADGKSQTQLLADSRAIIFSPSSCGADYLVLSWTFHGGTDSQSIWRTNVDGSNPIELTDGQSDAFPVCSPDQKWVYYSHWVDGHIYRVLLDGSGKAEAVSGIPQGYLPMGGLSISPDGKSLATAVTRRVRDEPAEKAAKIALLEIGSSRPPRMLDASHYSSGVQFTPDGKSVAYVARENGADNIWVQLLGNSAGHSITNFESEQIWSFCLSADGKSLAILRGHFDSDVVLLQESK